MRRIKSAPDNIAEMVNRRQEPAIPSSISLAKKDSKKVNKRPTERATSLLNDLLNDLLSPSFEETAFLGIVLNLLNNTFRRDKLRHLSGILAQQIIRYSIMFYIHHYILNDYIDRHVNIEIIHQLLH
jgi:hypothetical protein